MVEFFNEVEVKQISWNKNYRADMLARMAATVDPKLPKSVPLEVRTSPSIREEVEVMRVSTENPGWTRFLHTSAMTFYRRIKGKQES